MVQFGDGRGLAGRRVADDAAALGAGEARERAVLAPDAELQALLAENAVQGLLDQPAFLHQEGLAEGRFQPFLRQM